MEILVKVFYMFYALCNLVFVLFGLHYTSIMLLRYKTSRLKYALLGGLQFGVFLLAFSFVVNTVMYIISKG